MVIFADRAYVDYNSIENLSTNEAAIYISTKTNMKHIWDYDEV